jgi:hypothetical protein
MGGRPHEAAGVERGAHTLQVGGPDEDQRDSPQFGYKACEAPSDVGVLEDIPPDPVEIAETVPFHEWLDDLAVLAQRVRLHPEPVGGTR